MASKKQMAYKVYSALAKTPPVDLALTQVRARYQKKPSIRHDEQMKKLIEPQAAVSAEDLGLRIVSAPALGDDLTIDFLGALSDEVASAPEALPEAPIEPLLAALSTSIDGGAADARIAFLPERAASICDEEKAFFAVSKNESLLLKGASRSVLVFCQEFASSKEVPESALKALAYARQNNVDYVAAYIHNGRNICYQTKLLSAYAKRLVELGCNAVLGAGSDRIIADGASVKRWDGTMAYGFSSLGTVQEGPVAALRVGVGFSPMPIVRAGFIPLHVGAAGVVRIDAKARALPDEEQRSYTTISKGCGRYREWPDVVVLRDLFHIAGVEIPARYAHLAQVGVGIVSARHHNIKPGDVFCFLEAHFEANDNPSPTEVRKLRVDQTLARGAFFVLSFTKLSSCLPYAQIGNGRDFHIALCNWFRQKQKAVSVGITGSIGKTSTKDMLACVMSEGFVTYANARNSNAQVNIGDNIQDLRNDCRMYIQEIGGGRPGAAYRHGYIVSPTAAVVTNIGTAHLGNFHGDQLALCESKLGIADALVDGGTLYLNADDGLLRNAKVDRPVVYFAIHNKQADYYAESIVFKAGGTDFEVVHGDERYPIHLNVLGEYNVLNAVCAYAIAKRFGMTDERIARGLTKFHTEGARQNLITVGEYQIFADCYNASVDSYESSLSYAENVDVAGKRIAVLGDMTGVGKGEDAVKAHAEVGKTVSQHPGFHTVICYGENAAAIYETAKPAGINVEHLTDKAALVSRIEELMEPGDIILFKGSSKMKLVDVIDEVFATRLSDQISLDRGDFSRKSQGGVTYNVFKTHATAIESNDKLAECLTLAESVNGKPVRNIADGAFADMPNLTQVVLPASVVHIGSSAFADCPNLIDRDFTKSVRYLAKDAFVPRKE